LTQDYATGKVILIGEHAVVYGRPAIAVPVMDVRAGVIVEDAAGGSGITIYAPDIGLTVDVSSAPADEPLSRTVRDTLVHMGREVGDVHLSLTIRSSIPVASGLGSGTAVATAIVRALSAHLNHSFDAATVSSIVYETEKIYHGTPSGIDNTVVAFEQAVYFCKGRPIVTFGVKRPFWLAIADTGVPSLTWAAVADVRAAWQRDQAGHERIFDQIGSLADTARRAIEKGKIETLGVLMDENHRLLRQLGVSSPELELLVGTARHQGAGGAKLSGGGRGGNMIALVAPQNVERVRQALIAAGARNVIVTKVGR
jgi:mevalonate kinase